MKTLLVLLITFSMQAFGQLKVNKESDLTKNTFLEAFFLKEEIKDEFPSWNKTSKKRIDIYSPIIINIAHKLEIDPQLLLSMAWAENHFNPSARSSVGARGIMQVKPVTKEYILDKYFEKKNLRSYYTDLLNKYDVNHTIIDNLLSGGLYVKYLLNKFDGNVQKAVIAYNVDPTGTYRLIKKEFNLDKHRYYKKITKNIIAMN